jgi:hypothetical protein
VILKRKWWNWQTHHLEGVAPKGVGVQIPPSAPMPLGQLDFGKGVLAKCDIGLWRTRGEHKSLLGEFAFQVKFDSREEIGGKQKKLAADFYITLQQDVKDWLALGVTKTAMVYRLKGNEPQSHE